MASNGAEPAPPSEEGAGLVPTAAETVPVAPVAGAQAAEPFAGQNNFIDPWIYQNFVQAPEGEFTVSPRNAPGELLVTLSIGPRINPYLEHLSQMYNGFAGGMEVQVILAGNAFTAGKILIALVPPGFPVRDVTPGQLTMMPHTIADVRTMEPLVVPMPDVRRVLWHEVRSTDEDLMQLVIMLYTPLRANAGADDAFVVSGRVLTRPSPDFSFFYLVPPRAERVVEPFSLPPFTVREMSSSRWPNPLSHLHADPNANFHPQWQNGRCAVDGELLGTTPRNANWLLRFRGTVLQNPTGSTDNWQVHLELYQPSGEPFSVLEGEPGPEGVPDFTGTLHVRVSARVQGSSGELWATYGNITADHYTPALGTVVLTGLSIATAPTTGTELVAQVVSVDLAQAGDLNALPDYNGSAFDGSVNLAPALVPLLPGEVILRFGSLPITTRRDAARAVIMDCALPQEWITWFLAHNFVPQGAAALLRYRNQQTGQLLFEAKLYTQGFVVVAGITVPTQFPIDGVFQFVSWVPAFFQLSPVGNRAGRRLRQ